MVRLRLRHHWPFPRNFHVLCWVLQDFRQSKTIWRQFHAILDQFEQNIADFQLKPPTISPYYPQAILQTKANPLNALKKIVYPSKFHIASYPQD